jgi:hypothetical protein
MSIVDSCCIDQGINCGYLDRSGIRDFGSKIRVRSIVRASTSTTSTTSATTGDDYNCTKKASPKQFAPHIAPMRVINNITIITPRVFCVKLG